MVLKMKIRIKLQEGAKAPFLSTKGSGGYDLCAYLPTIPNLVWPRKTVSVDTGVFMEIPEGYVGLMIPRSSLQKKGLEMANTVGVIDSDYRGQIRILLRETEGRCKLIENGDKLVQLVIVPIPQIEFDIVDELSNTKRGSGGFGSTDK